MSAKVEWTKIEFFSILKYSQVKNNICLTLWIFLLFITNIKFWQISWLDTLSSGFFIASLIYGVTVSIPEAKNHKIILSFLLNEYYLAKKNIFREIILLIDKQNQSNIDINQIALNPIKAAEYFNKDTDGMSSKKFHDLQNALNQQSFADIFFPLQKLGGILQLFSNSKTALEFNLVPPVIKLINSINFDQHYFINNSELGDNQFTPFLSHLYFLFTGYDFYNYVQGKDHFADTINEAISKI